MGPARPEIGQRGEIAKGLKGRKRLSLREKERGQLLAPPRLCPMGKPKLQESQEQGDQRGLPDSPLQQLQQTHGAKTRHGPDTQGERRGRSRLHCTSRKGGKIKK